MKKLVIFLLMAVAIVLPGRINAQNDMFFRINNEDVYNDRASNVDVTGTMTNNPFGEPAPIGSGLLVMVAAGAGYVALKRKRSNKTSKSHTTFTAVLAFAMVLAFTGCKKRIETIVPDNGKSVDITLNVNGGGRHSVILDQETGYSPVAYREGDIIYVGDGTSYVGSLTCQSDGTTFAGAITLSSPPEDLYFYYVGGLTPQNWGGEVGEKSFTVDIHDQSNSNTAMDNTHKLPVLSIGKDSYHDGKISFSCALDNKCALVKFRLQAKAGDEGLANVRISNMLSEAKIDFANNSITPTGALDAITLYCGPSNNGEQTVTNMYFRWAILLPSDTERSGYVIVADGFQFANNKYYNKVTIPEIVPDSVNYLYEPIQINNKSTNETSANLYMVSDNLNVVEFSPGNLQYHPNSGKWYFATKTWSYIGNDTYGNVYWKTGTNDSIKCSNTKISTNSYQGLIDLFGWGAWGYDTKADICNASTDNSDYTWTSDFQGTIENDSHNDWRTLTRTEWAKLNTIHNNNKKIGKGTVFGVRSEIILPINNTATIENYQWTTLEINSGNWATWRSNGAVVLPATGIRNGTTVTKAKPDGNDKNTEGYYWSVSEYSQTHAGYAANSSGKASMTTNDLDKHYGFSIRLVR